MRATRISLALAAVAVAATLAACSSGGVTISTPSTPASLPTSLPTGLPTGVPTGIPTNLPTGIPTNLPTGIPTNLPTGLPSGIPTNIPGVGSLTKGTAHVVLSGDVSTTVDLPTLQSGVFAPGAGLALVWVDSNGDAFSIGGLAQQGSHQTSPTLEASVVVHDNTSITAATSVAGECTVDITTATTSNVAGTVKCANLNASGQTIGVNATFSASA